MIRTAKVFLDDDFLLSNDIAVQLYESYASSMPIVDYHNHLSPEDIASNRKFSNITEAWLEGDHYKWRAMRINGVPEKYCTGQVPPFEKFQAWARTVPYTMRNPLYHWTHLELKNYFGVRKLLNEQNAREIYDECSTMLHQDDFSVLSLLSKMNVEVVCTTDDPVDSLAHHQQFAKAASGLRMFPTFRPDKAYATEDAVAYNAYLGKLSEVSGTSIRNFDDLILALKKRIDFFESCGCRASDHGLESLYFDDQALSAAPALFKKLIGGTNLVTDERLQFRCAVLIHLCRFYREKNWAQQFHLGALRNNNTRMKRALGADTGFDSVGDFQQATHMSRFFDHLDSTDQLAKTIIYNLNPSQNEVFATMAGNFSDGSIPGKIQFGSGWWFLDQKDGMEKQMNVLSNMGLLSRFVGMVTDSRSFLSFPRHEYFRRILCNLLAKDMEAGELPDDLPRVGQMIRDICYFNAERYFNFNV
jgi:glucuronate isomerase